MSTFAQPQRAEGSLVASDGVAFRRSEQTENWYAIYTKSRHEKSVSRQLLDSHISHFLPLYRKRCRWKSGRLADLELPLFANYVFVRMALVDRVRVLRTPGVVSFVSCGRNPVPIRERDIQMIAEAVRSGKVEPHPYLVAGSRVRIKAGALAGVEGVVARKKNSFRVVLMLDLIAQGMAIEIDQDNLEPVTVRAN